MDVHFDHVSEVAPHIGRHEQGNFVLPSFLNENEAVLAEVMSMSMEIRLIAGCLVASRSVHALRVVEVVDGGVTAASSHELYPINIMQLSIQFKLNLEGLRSCESNECSD